MGCFDPVLVRDSKSGRIFRNWSLASLIHKQGTTVVFDCGKCRYCRPRRSAELAMRCVLENSLHARSCFLTLTYDEKREGYLNVLRYSDIQKFKKVLRRYLEPDRVRVFNVHEYGKNRKKHWHLLVFGWDPHDKEFLFRSGDHALYRSPILESKWTLGISTVGSVAMASAMYMSLYTQKDFKNNNLTNGMRAKSNHAGLGRSYFMLHWRQILTLGFIPFGEKKFPVPRYFEKLASEAPHMAELFKFYTVRRDEAVKEREVLWDELIRDYDRLLPTDFEKSGANSAYDLSRKFAEERF